MQIYQIIDSLELNGGSTMFLELVSSMQKYWPDVNIKSFVVSKTGQMGRENLVSKSLFASYKVDIEVYSYETFAPIASSIRNATVFHHVLGHTSPIRFDKSCRYIVVNHTMTNVKRLPDFKSDHIVSVCKYFGEKFRAITRSNSIVILNGCDSYDEIEPCIPKNDRFIIGCCQRVVPSKFNTRKRTIPNNCLRYIIGPVNPAVSQRHPNYNFLGPVFDKQKKLSYIKGFDAYLHDSNMAEGASMAILESLSCGVPVLANDVGGGTKELIIDGVNGYMFKNNKTFLKIVNTLSNDRKFLKRLKERTREDFMNRLHIRNVLPKYRRLCLD